MRNLMKLVAVVAVMTMAGAAFADSIDANGLAKFRAGDQSMSRGLLNCTTEVIEIPGLSVNDGLELFGLGPSDVLDWPTTTAYQFPGDELVFHFEFPTTAPDGYEWTFTWSHDAGAGDVWVDLFVMDGCGEENTYYMVWSDGTGGSINGTGGWTGDLWLALDSETVWSGVIPWTFNATEYIAPEPLEFCEYVQDVSGTGIFNGDTCGGPHMEDANGSGDGCVLTPPMDTIEGWVYGNMYYTDGDEAYYGIFMPAGSSFSAHVTHTCDASLRLFDACMEPFYCIGYMDWYWSGAPPEAEETLPFTNDTGADMMVYLIVDSYDACCGTFVLDFTSSGGAIANEQMSLGEVKALYR